MTPAARHHGIISSFWGALSPWGKRAAMLVPILVVIGWLAPYALALLELAPYASKRTEAVVVVLVDREEQRINSGQITRQSEIERLKGRCMVRCDQFDKKSLDNLIEKWQTEQKELDRLRQKR